MLKYVIQYIWADKTLRYLLLASLGIVIFMVIYVTGSSAHHKNKRTTYWIDGGITMLGFIGDPNTLKVTPVKFTTSKTQPIKLLHKKSGPGIWAFKLPGLEIKDSFGRERVVMNNGYILVKRRWIRTTVWKKKTSLKYKTMKGIINENG